MTGDEPAPPTVTEKNGDERVTILSMPPDQAVTEAARRANLAQDFTDAGAWIACNLAAIIPDDFTFQLHVPRGLDHEAKREWLRQVARSWRVPVLPDGEGGETAEKVIGELRFIAHISPEGSGHIVRRLAAAA